MDYNSAFEFKKQLTEDFLKKRNSYSYSFSGGGIATASIMTAKDIMTGVIGLGVGQKEDEEDFFIKIFTEGNRNIDINHVSNYLGVPKEDLIVETTGEIIFMNANGQYRPPVPSISVGHFDVSAGTLGCFVSDPSNRVYMLSNNHVLANCNNCRIGDEILQPGKLHGGNKTKPGDILGYLERYIDLEYSRPNVMDCAIASLKPEFEPKSYEVPGIGKVEGNAAPALKMKVKKSGIRGFSEGVITTVGVDFQVKYNYDTLDFENQFEIKGLRVAGVVRKMFSRQGDSGSVIVESETMAAVGLLFAGSYWGAGFASPINPILETFNVNIL